MADGLDLRVREVESGSVHWAMHGVGGFVGGVVGLLWAWGSRPCTALNGFVVCGHPTQESLEGHIGGCAFAGVILYHLGKELYEAYEQRERAR